MTDDAEVGDLGALIWGVITESPDEELRRYADTLQRDGYPVAAEELREYIAERHA